MKWQGRRQSSNVDDRRGRSGGGSRGFSGGKAAGGFGIGTVVIVILALLFGVDPSEILGVTNTGGGGTTTSAPSGLQTPQGSQEDELGQFVAVVLAETEDVWNAQFPQSFNQNYREPVLVLFSGQDRSACGFASAATGPFYCPADQKVYIDLSFYDQLRQRFKAPGDFAMAYVIAHEVGHHIQQLTGYSQQVSQARGRVSEAQQNDLSVRLELQADYLAGVWAHHAQRTAGILQDGDIDEAIRAATAIGDDRLQMEAQGYVVPESFTHGTSEQRVRYFTQGYQSGDLSKGKLDAFFQQRQL